MPKKEGEPSQFQPDKMGAVPEEAMELSKEKMEQILEMVRDINETGLAYSGVCRTDDLEARLPSVLEHGLVGAPGGLTARQEQEQSNQPTNSYFNINGRSKNVHNPVANIIPVDPDKPQLYHGRFSTGTVNVIFDASAFHEVDKTFYLEYYRRDTGYNSHRRSQYDGRIPMKPDEYMVTPSPEDPKVVIEDSRDGKQTMSFSPGTGFVTTGIIKPEYIKGIIIPEVLREATGQELKEHPEIPFRVDDSPQARIQKELWAKAARDIMETTYQDRSEKLLPVYDSSGNLLWPKQMSYKEVKLFAGEKEISESE